jgi:hypothetical protein
VRRCGASRGQCRSLGSDRCRCARAPWR